MKRSLLVCVAALGVGCGGSSNSDVVDTTARVDLQDGTWLLTAGDGIVYAPGNLPEAFEVVGGYVDVGLRATGGGDGTQPIPAEIVTVSERSCIGFVCGEAYPAVTVRVVDATSSGAIDGVTISSLLAPAEQPGSGAPTAGCSTDPDVTTCTILSYQPGAHAFDVVAPGYRTAHVEVDVPAYVHVLGHCCEQPFVPQTVEVRLERGV